MWLNRKTFKPMPFFAALNFFDPHHPRQNFMDPRHPHQNFNPRHPRQNFMDPHYPRQTLTHATHAPTSSRNPRNLARLQIGILEKREPGPWEDPGLYEDSSISMYIWKNVQKKKTFTKMEFTKIVLICYINFHNQFHILKFFNVLPNFPSTISETMCDYYL